MRFIHCNCRLALPAMLLLCLLTACQGASQGTGGPRPRSREAAGEFEQLPADATTGKRASIDSDGGEVEYRLAKLTIPRGALTEQVFVEIEIPTEKPVDVLPESAVRINPDGLELLKDGLLTMAYYDDDVPAGYHEEDIVIVHNVNGVWVEISNSRVYIHNNTVEAPIRFLGLYALRVAREDPRVMNTQPIAKFDFSTEPYAQQEGISLDEARQQMEAPVEQPPPGAETPPTGETPPAGPPAPEEEEEEAPPTGDTLPVAPPSGVGPPGSAPPGSAPPTSGLIRERRVVGAQVAPGVEARDAGTGAAGNVAEGAPPVSAIGSDERPEVMAQTPEVKIYFNASASSDPDGSVVQYDWDFNADGVFDFTSSRGPYAEHVFRRNGDYTVVLKVTDNGRYARSGYGTQVVRIRNAAAEQVELSANIGAYPAFGEAPLTVHFGATAVGGQAPYSYLWTFSDGSESTLANPYTTYADCDDHLVQFEVTDITGATMTGSLLVTTYPGDTPSQPQSRMEMDISPRYERGQAPVNAKFRIELQNATEPVTYQVTYGDEPEGADPIVTTSSFLEHAYGNSGFYVMKVVATDADLRTASTFATIHAWDPESPRDFTVSDKTIGEDPFSFGHEMRISFDYTEASPRTVQFLPEQTPIDIALLAYQWDFGDGTYSTDAKPEHTFAHDGVYEVRLTASDGLQRWRTRMWLPISSESPAAAIQRPIYVEGPAPLRLNWEAVVTRGQEPLRYDWEFGTDRSSDASTYYSFQEPGDYKVRLTILDKFDQKIIAPYVDVRVRPGPADYRLPLAVIEPLTGSTRAVVMDYTAANPLPLSSPSVEGAVNLVDISSDGRHVALATEDGMVMKNSGNAMPVVAYLPANGSIVALRALEAKAAYATVRTSSGLETYLVREGASPVFVGTGAIEHSSGDGSMVVLRETQEDRSNEMNLVPVDAQSGQVGRATPLGRIYGARFPRDGRELFYINSDSRVVRRHLPTGKEDYLTGGDDRKSSLAVSADGNAIAFVATLGEQRDVIYGRDDALEGWRLASVTDQTGFFSEQIALSADGTYLIAYGSRRELFDLLAAAGGESLAEDELAPESGQTAPGPPVRRERFGIVRLDLSGAPDDWSIISVDPRFVTESGASFATAGPF